MNITNEAPREAITTSEVFADALNSNVLRVSLYLLGAVLCLVAGIRERRSADRRSLPTFWFAAAATMLVLGFARETELGNFVTTSGRDFAKSHGWYPERRPIQRLADMAVTVLAGLAIVGALCLPMWRRRTQLVAACVLVLLACFVVVRAISYHNVDQVLYNHPWHGIRMNSVIELLLTLSLSAVAFTAVCRSTPTDEKDWAVARGRIPRT